MNGCGPASSTSPPIYSDGAVCCLALTPVRAVGQYSVVGDRDLIARAEQLPPLAGGVGLMGGIAARVLVHTSIIGV